MSSIIPVDLLSYATNPLYLSSLVTTNVSNPTVIKLLAYDQSFASVLGENATARQLYDLDHQAFHEGGVYNKDAKKLYVTSNWAGDVNNPINVTIIDLADNYSYTTTRYSNLAEGNGLTSYYPPGAPTNSTPTHILYADEGDLVNPAGLVSVDPVTGTSERILTSYLGRNFSSINDVRQHPVTGDIWFTDADYGYFQYFRPAPTIPKQVYRFSPATGDIAVVATDFVQCNGLEFSPDFKTLYVSDTGAAGFDKNLTRPATIFAFDVMEDMKRLTGRRVFAYADNGFPDGVHCDTEGNVWAGCGDGIHVWNPAGKLLGKIWNGVETNNFAFLPGAVLVFSNAQLWIVENLKAVGREVSKDFGI
ncbi:smp-30 gluconolaconase lre-like region [Pyrenophora seminiperda CCB06]|uniref:Smp-30 gluconolaconase lre-like region n=1 Tax=Pyrenophora seminiperda CCB06 TaxID=1302712 RepID=A0A3M7M291_9PLEO|nr:smp-30 gluconolaconase lre-like region [Pyrenophora seminiperda CCB06]